VPSESEIIVEAGLPSSGYGDETLVSAGSRNNEILKAGFPNSPVMWSTDTDWLVTDDYMIDSYKVLLDSTATGYCFPNAVNLNYGPGGTSEGAPDIANTEVSNTSFPDGGNGFPVMAKALSTFGWPVPTPMNAISSVTSAGGSIAVGATPKDQEPYLGEAIEQKSINYGSGPQWPENPSDQVVGDQDFTDLSFGSSS
jgi:hypothetical protein